MPESCKWCGEPMIVLHWNSVADVLTCNNSSCRLFRQPTSIPKGSVPTLAEDLSNVLIKSKRRPKTRKYAAFTFEERLQELRDKIST